MPFLCNIYATTFMRPYRPLWVSFGCSQPYVATIDLYFSLRILVYTRPSGRDREARIQSGGCILRYFNFLASRLRRSAGISLVLETARESTYLLLHFFVTNGGSQLTFRTQLEKVLIFRHTFSSLTGSQLTF